MILVVIQQDHSYVEMDLVENIKQIVQNSKDVKTLIIHTYVKMVLVYKIHGNVLIKKKDQENVLKVLLDVKMVYVELIAHITMVVQLVDLYNVLMDSAQQMKKNVQEKVTVLLIDLLDVLIMYV